jgi:hypothetical protein
MLAHISWADDHLTIVNPRTKTDQTGENAFPKSIYANPFQPQLCPILAIAISTFTRSAIGCGKLFEGPDQEERYCKILAGVLASVPESLIGTLGAKREDIGSHSCRKGAATHVLSLPGGPSSVSVFLRAGWTLGNVKDRYIHEGDGADQLCGRYVFSKRSD